MKGLSGLSLPSFLGSMDNATPPVRPMATAETLLAPVFTLDNVPPSVTLPAIATLPLLPAGEAPLPEALPQETVVEPSAPQENDPHALLAWLLGQPVPAEPVATAGLTAITDSVTSANAPAMNKLAQQLQMPLTQPVSRLAAAPDALPLDRGQQGGATAIPQNAVLNMPMAVAQPQGTVLKPQDDSVGAMHLTLQPLSSPVSQALIARDMNVPPLLKMPTETEEQGKALRQALGERLQMQVDSRQQHATIRLDPPNLGKLDISLHFEAGKLQVQIQAQQPEIARALQQISHELRGALSENNNVHVNVQVSTQSGDSRQQPRQHTQPEAQIAHNNEEVQVRQDAHRTDGTILTTV